MMFLANTDMYQLRMAKTHIESGKAGEIGVAEAFFRKLPAEWEYAVMCGGHRILELLNPILVEDWVLYVQNPLVSKLLGKDFYKKYNGWLAQTQVNIRLDGSILFPQEPVVQVIAPLPMLHLLETQILSILNHDVRVASKASRIREAAGLTTLMEFGSRRTDIESAVHAAYAAMVGGFNVTSNVAAHLRYAVPCSGTMAHAFVQAYASEQAAFEDFLRLNPEDGILLIDTYDVMTGCARAIKAAVATGVPLKGIRIDSGDFGTLVPQVRSMLDAFECMSTQIVLSNDLDEYSITQLPKDVQSMVSAYGVGTRVVSPPDASSMGFVYKLVELEGRPVFKNSATPGKRTFPYRKRVNLENGAQHVRRDTGAFSSELENLIHNGDHNFVAADQRRRDRLLDLHGWGLPKVKSVIHTEEFEIKEAV